VRGQRREERGERRGKRAEMRKNYGHSPEKNPISSIRNTAPAPYISFSELREDSACVFVCTHEETRKRKQT
jgi:hypothetical protein